LVVGWTNFVPNYDEDMQRSGTVQTQKNRKPKMVDGALRELSSIRKMGNVSCMTDEHPSTESEKRFQEPIAQQHDRLGV
jgi:hypothetical protein